MSKYNIHKWKDEELNDLLMERWGYKKKPLNEQKMPMKTDTEDADEDGDTTDKVPAFVDKGETKKKKKGGKIPPQLEPHVRKAQGKKDGDDGEEDEEEVNEAMSTDGVRDVAGGDMEGLANAAIAAIVQLAAEAGVELDVTTGEDAIPDDEDELDMDMEDDAGPEAGEEELLSPEDL
jgi:hypothetical protein